MLSCMIIGAVFFAAAHSLTAAAFHVSPSGNDAQPGTREQPFATLARARDAVRQLKQTGPRRGETSILLHRGVHWLNEPLTLTPEDSGAPGAPIVYAAVPGEKPIVSGGRRIGGWRKQDDRLWVAEVPWVKQRSEPFTQLFVNGERRIRARTPNVGNYFYSKRLELTEGNPGQCVGLAFVKGDLGPWVEQRGAQIVLFHNWVNSYNRIKRVDFESRRLNFARPAGIFFLGPEVRYYVENVPAALDAPGEWHLDREQGLLRYYPLPGEDLAKAEVIAPVVTSSLVVVKGDWAKGQWVEHLAFRGLSFQHTDANLSANYPHSVQGAHTQRGAFFAVGLRSSVIENCEFTRLGEHGISLREGCHSNIIRQCHIHDLGGGGVYLSEGAPARTNDAYLTAYHHVDNNFIHDGGHIYRAACGVFLGGSASYNHITHNEVCNLSWMGVHLGWSWTGKQPAYTHHNEVAYNHLHHLGNGVLNDIGGIYTLGVSPGTVLHHNHIHHVTRFERGKEGYGGWGIYLDAGSSEILVENNVVHDTRDGGLHLHCDGYPYGDVVQNNIFAYSRDAELIRNNNKEAESNHVSLERNLVYGDSPRMFGGGNWKAGAKFNSDRNCFWSVTTNAPDFYGKTLAAWQAEGRDRNSLVADPNFVNPGQRDFRLKPNSPALALGFQPIDISRAGLYGPTNWTSLPKSVQPRPVEQAAAPVRPVTINETFEDYAVGDRPDYARLYENKKDAVIRVTSELAGSGKQCLKFTDAPGQKFAHEPHLAYEWEFPEGVLRASFDLRLEPGAIFYHEWRDWPKGQNLQSGPTLRVNADGSLVAGGRKIMTLPHQQWINFEILCGTGPQANGRWQVTVRPPGQEPRRIADLTYSAKFRQLNWLGFISMATNNTVFYLDNLRLEKAESH